MCSMSRAALSYLGQNPGAHGSGVVTVQENNSASKCWRVWLQEAPAMALRQGARPGGILLQDSAYTPHRKGKATVRISLCQGLPAGEGQPGQGGRI